MDGLGAYRDRKVGVLGLGRSGRAVARALATRGVDVILFDDDPHTVARALEIGGRAGKPEILADLALLVVSPGVPLTHPAPHPLITAARGHGVPIAGDIDLFAATYPETFLIGVTGTNGKSTTTALIAHILAEAGLPATAAGNIGRPVFELEPAAGDILVLELSSFQLDLSRSLRCRVAVWLNLEPDHLDRHGDLEGYIAAKRRLFAGQRAEDRAVIAVDDPVSRALAGELEAAGRWVTRVSGVSAEADVGVEGDRLVERVAGEPRRIADLSALAGLRGTHNRQNATAAFAVARLLEVPADRAAQALAGFPGLPHRMQEVGRLGRVRFVNDSKATNPAAAGRSLASFSDIYWIAGGRAKPGGFAALRPHLGNVRKAFLIGEAAEELAGFLAGRVPAERVGELGEAVSAAATAARTSDAAEPVVLLAPACASFDQFPDFEARGRAFAAHVAALATPAAGGVS